MLYLPAKGILSFFIDYDDELWGLNLEDPKDTSGYRVTYFPEVEMDKNKLISDFSFLGEGRCCMLEPDEEYSFSFQLESQLVSMPSYEWQQQFEMHSFDYIEDLGCSDERTDEIYEEYMENSSKVGHQIGGYPFFTQEDPRYRGEEYLKYDFLMLQLDSDDHIMWGDAGIANFMISFEKLKQRDFSDVLFNWNCH